MAGFWLYKNQNTPQTGGTASLAPTTPIELVNSVTNLSDEQDEVLKERVSQSIKAFKENINPNLGMLKGLYSKCYLEGHDVHWIDESGALVKHIEIKMPLEGVDLEARNIIYKAGGGHVVVIYQNGFEAYAMDGKLIKSGN